MPGFSRPECSKSKARRLSRAGFVTGASNSEALAGDALDIGAVDAEVGEFAV